MSSPKVGDGTLSRNYEITPTWTQKLPIPDWKLKPFGHKTNTL